MGEIESLKPRAGAARARGVTRNAAGRFEAHSKVRIEDDWWQDAPDVIQTEVALDTTKTVLTRNTSPDLPFDRSVNPYRGCEHGCSYCFARPSHAYLGLSPGLDFETKLFAKPDAAETLAKELSRRRYSPKTIAIGTNTDPYQPVEKRMRIMRGVLEVLRDFRHPVAIVTKGAMIRRDIDILGPMAADGLAAVGISLTSLDADLCRKMEPRASSPVQRLKTIRALADAGVPVRAMIAPVVPGLTDHELEDLLSAARDSGASTASYIMLRLPLEVSELFQDWLAEAYPGRAAGVMTRVRSLHGGRDYDPAWGKRMRGSGVLANLLARRFEVATRRLGLGEQRAALRDDLFRVPDRSGQLSLFD